MSGERIEQIKSAVEAADHIPAEKKVELLGTLSKIKPAIDKVAETHAENAHSIAKLVEASATAVARKDESPERLHKLLHELKRSAENFEASHPDLVAAVTEYSALLSALGI